MGHGVSAPDATAAATPQVAERLAALEARLRAAPFHEWLGLRVLGVDDDGLRIGATWRTEWENGTEQRVTHGGIIAALLDLTADWAIADALGQPAPTLDFQVHYLRAAAPGDLVVVGRVVKPGRSITFAEAELYDGQGKQVAVGRGTYASFAAPGGA